MAIYHILMQLVPRGERVEKLLLAQGGVFYHNDIFMYINIIYYMC